MKNVQSYIERNIVSKSQKKTLLLLISIIVISGCSSQSNQSQPQSISQNKPITKLEAVRVSTSGVASAEPAIASGKDGMVYVVWVEHKANKEADVMFQKFDSNAQPKGDKVRVNPQIGKATAWRGDPPTIKIGQDDAVYIGWTEKVENETARGNNLYLSVSRDSGNSFEASVKVNDDIVPASHGMHSLAVDNLGHVYFVWLDERYLSSHKVQAKIKKDSDETYHFEKAVFFQHQESEEKPEPNAELYFSVSSDKGKTFSVNKRLAENVCPCCKTSLLAASDGRLYASWRQVLTDDFRHIAVTSSTDNGNNFSPPVIVSDDKWQISACPVSGASLTTNPDNTLKVAWFTAGAAGKQGLYSSESKDGGKTFSPRALISESTISGAPVWLNDETLKNRIVWADNEKIIMASLQEKNLGVENKQEIGEGELLDATVNNGKLFFSFVKKENDISGIWLSSMNK